MKNTKKVIEEILEIQKGGSQVNDLSFNNAPLFLIGYCSLNNITNKFDLDVILNSNNSK